MTLLIFMITVALVVLPWPVAPVVALFMALFYWIGD
jgi:hypothetical protein